MCFQPHRLKLFCDCYSQGVKTRSPSVPLFYEHDDGSELQIELNSSLAGVMKNAKPRVSLTGEMVTLKKKVTSGKWP